MAYWQIRVPYEGTASIVIESDKKPSLDEYRRVFHSGKFDKGLPQYNLSKADVADVEEVNENQYKYIDKLIKRKAFKKIVKEIKNG